jgi:hypothetical protein
MALMALGKEELDAQAVRETVGCIVKYYEDLKQLEDSGMEDLLSGLPLKEGPTCGQIPCA